MLGGGTSAISRTVDGCGVGAAQLGKSPAAITTGHKSFPLSSHRRRHTTSQPQPWLVPRLVSNTECDTTTEHTAAADKTCNRVSNAGQIPAVGPGVGHGMCVTDNCLMLPPFPNVPWSSIFGKFSIGELNHQVSFSSSSFASFYIFGCELIACP